MDRAAREALDHDSMLDPVSTDEDPDALLAEDPDADPHQLLLLAQVYPEKVLDNASLLLLHFVDLDLARSIHATARGTIAADRIDALAACCGPRALALLALDAARRATSRWGPPLPRVGRVLRALDLAEQHAREGGPRGALDVLEGRLRCEMNLPLQSLGEVASASRSVLAALESALAGRASLARLAALDAAELAATAIAGGDELAYAEERERQAQALAALHAEHGPL